MTDKPTEPPSYFDFNDALDKPPKISKKISADEIKTRLSSNLESTLQSLYPAGRIEGKHFVIGNVCGKDGDSLKITLSGKYKGCWKDFGENASCTASSGDIFALFAATFEIDAKKDFKKLLERIAEWLGDPVQFYQEATYKDVSAGSTAQRGAPVDDLGMWVAKFDYHDADGNLIACVYKYLVEKGKTFRCWDVLERKWKAPDPRPLYNLSGIIKSDLVFIVEGEKCADAMIAAGYCATTLIGGCKNPIEKADFMPLKGKTICVWPDNDPDGKKYAEELIKKLHEFGIEIIKLLLPPENAFNKWDAADAFKEDFNVPAFIDKAIDGVGHSFEPPKIRTFTFGDMFNDATPMPPDVIGPRILGPGDIGVLVGASKAGKSHFILSAAMHWAAGKSFIGMEVDRPLKIVYLQAEIGYFYMRERVQGMYPDLAKNSHVQQNLVISEKFSYCLNDEGKEEFIRICLTAFEDGEPDLVIIDPLRNVFHSERENATENDNTAMIEFFRDGVMDFQKCVNSKMAVILPHHLNKSPKKIVAEELFNTISGAGAIRSFYTSCIFLFKENLLDDDVDVYFELRNGPPIPPKFLTVKNREWVEREHEQLTPYTNKRDRKNKKGREYRMDKIEEILEKDALQKGLLYTRAAFAKKYQDKHGLKSASTIQRDFEAMCVAGCCKFTNEIKKYNQDPVPTKDGYLVTENTVITIDGEQIKVTPTHFVKDNNMVLHEVENPNVWVKNDEEERQ